MFPENPLFTEVKPHRRTGYGPLGLFCDPLGLRPFPVQVFRQAGYRYHPRASHDRLSRCPGRPYSHLLQYPGRQSSSGKRYSGRLYRVRDTPRTVHHDRRHSDAADQGSHGRDTGQIRRCRKDPWRVSRKGLPYNHPAPEQAGHHRVGILTWAKALGEFGATITVAGSMAMKTETLPIAIFMRLASADIEGTAVLVLILVGLGLGLLYGVRVLTGRQPYV